MSTTTDDTTTPSEGSGETTSETRTVLAIVLGLTTLLAVMLTAFAWTTSEIEPREVPIVVAGPEQATGPMAEQLSASGEEAFEVTTVADRAAAVEAIEEREAYAGLVVGAEPELLTAPAASPAVASLMTEALAADGAGTTVTEVVPLPEGDPNGQIFSSVALPLLLGGIATGVLASIAVRGRWAKVATISGVAVAGGLVLTAILQPWLGALEGSYLVNASVIALAIAATSTVMAGLHSLIGYAGIGLTALAVLLVGNPFSGLATGPKLLPSGWSTLGQLLPPGAAGQALRSTAFFDGAGAAMPLTVLVGWIVVGLSLLGLSAAAAPGGLRLSRRARSVGRDSNP